MSSCFSSIGFRLLMDADASYYGGQDVYYRTQNFSAEGNPFVAIGLSVPDDTAKVDDMLICPTVDVTDLSDRQINDATAAGVDIKAGAKSFTISHTWVARIKAAKGFSRFEEVFEDQSVIGLYFNKILYEIARAKPTYFLNSISDWVVIGNGSSITSE